MLLSLCSLEFLHDPKQTDRQINTSPNLLTLNLTCAVLLHADPDHSFNLNPVYSPDIFLKLVLITFF